MTKIYMSTILQRPIIEREEAGACSPPPVSDPATDASRPGMSHAILRSNLWPGQQCVAPGVSDLHCWRIKPCRAPFNSQPQSNVGMLNAKTEKREGGVAKILSPLVK